MEQITNYTSSISDQHPMLILDGMNNFIRHYVVNQAANANGDLYGGTLGFLSTIRQLVKTFRPSRVLVVWEQGGPCSRRKSLCKEYKANRAKQKDFDGMYKSDRDALMSDAQNKAKQLSVLTKALGFLPITQVYVPDCEGDDVVAYIVKRKFMNHKSLKVVASGDKDFYQLLEDPSVRIYSPIKKTLTDSADVLTEYKIAPRNFCLARTLVGDVSDNITGVPGVGLTTVAKRFPFLSDETKDYFLKDILAYAKEQVDINPKKAPKCYQAVLDNEDVAKLNWQLMYLDTFNFSAAQIDKIDSKIDGFKPVLNHLEFMKSFAAAEIPITRDMSDLSQELRYLTVSS